MAVRSRFKRGQRVWAAVTFNPRAVRGLAVTYLGTRDGRFLQVEGPDGDRHSVPRFYTFVSREELVKKCPGVEVDPDESLPPRA
jgi:hypothetical protein